MPNGRRQERETLHEGVMDLFRLCGLEKPSVIVCYILPPGYNDVHWISNVERRQTISMLRELANKMEAQLN